ncbi:uncharacterized protein G2W53_038515 [Senna tora]|uniref:Uncharacterized protein n=1 Tax=Senna tora TaxID=362788 RepID=A0A834SZI8_9FABA|nr:uncharacterized protein G2W53_038515 [Senna tora]
MAPGRTLLSEYGYYNNGTMYAYARIPNGLAGKYT